MNTKQLMVAAGLLLLATACKEDDTVKPSYVAPVINGPAPAQTNLTAGDSVYTTEGKSGPVQVRTTQEASTPKQDVMPVQLLSAM